MADVVVASAASDLFSLHANFVEQGSSDSDLDDYAQTPDANGDVNAGCESAAFNARNEYTNEFKFCGTDIVSDFGVVLSTFGVIANLKQITEITVQFSNTDFPIINVTGHNHDAQAHGATPALPTFDFSAAIPAVTGGVGVPDIWSNSASATSTPTSVTVTFAIDHIDALDANGAHFVGTNKNGRVDVTADYINTPTLTTTNWKIDSQVLNDSNTDFDTFNISAHRYYTRN
jgi:hypothetical protein